MSVLNWIFFHKVYGAIVLAAVSYLLLRRPNSRRGELAAILVFLSALGTIFYLFEYTTIGDFKAQA